MTNNQKYARFPRSAFVGFDHIFKELEDMTKHAADHYPPHNIIKDEDMKYRIEVATAGFKEEELSVELKDGILEVNGDHTPRGLEFIHKGTKASPPVSFIGLLDCLNIHKLQELLWRTVF
jgi:molecular chaperone IbpA